MRVALVTSEALPLLHEDDRLLLPALQKLGIVGEPAVWSAADVDWQSFDALVIRSPWDYFRRVAEFRAWLSARRAGGPPLCNAGEILAWNFEKHYLTELANARIPTIPTIVIPAGDHPDIAALAQERGWDEIVVKPTISGGAYETHRFRRAYADQYRASIAHTLRDRGLLIQPFLPEILRDGELSLLFFDGAFSHAVRKRPQGGDYRVQPQFGGTVERVEARAEWIDTARACIAAAPSLPTYARVDGVIVNGRFVLMELEVFEPLMFLAHHPLAAERFAKAIERLLR
ncbi:MAG: hypothetical protein SF069_09315 [Phycisphaerae bacterium]|nr:hypothetical protein [Phycisphaerae bacterium]